MAPWLPTKLGITTADFIGTLIPLDCPSSLVGANTGFVVMGFRPFSFQDGSKTFWCNEGQCTIRIPQGRFDALGLSPTDEISVINASVTTLMPSGSYHWLITVSDYPDTMVGAHANRSDLKRTIDTFAGLTNWSQVATKLGLTSLISIDNCEDVANVGAKNLKVSKWSANSFTDHWTHDYGRMYRGKPTMLVADIRNQYIREPVSSFRCGLMLGSPPCQPWSWLSTRMGLADDRGKLFLETAVVAEFLGCFLINLENVVGITQHDDWLQVIQFYREHGYALIYTGIDSLRGYLPTNRSRANVIFARFDFHHVEIPTSMCLTDSIWGDLSAKSFGVIHSYDNLKDATLHGLTHIDDDDLKILSDPNYFTKEVSDRVKAGASPLAARSKSRVGPLPCPTARYGSPGFLSEKTLSDNKLTMVVHRDGDKYRWFSPFEFMLGLGLPISTMLPIDRQIAFLAVGNTISPLHVALNINRTLFCMGDCQRTVRAVASIVQQFAERQFPIYMCDVHCDHEVMWLEPKVDPYLKMGPANVEVFEEHSDHLKRKHDGCDQHHDVPIVKHAKRGHDSKETMVILLNRQCSEMTFSKHDELITVKKFISTVPCDRFLMLLCEINVSCKNLSQIHEIVELARACAKSVVTQFANLRDPIVPTVQKIEDRDFISCWIQTKQGFEHRDCSCEASFRDLVSVVEHPIAVIVFPESESLLPQEVPTVLPAANVKAVWIRCGANGELHQIWLGHESVVGDLHSRYHVPGYTCRFYVNGVLQHENKSICEIQDVIEIRQCVITPQRAPAKYRDVFGDVIVTSEDRFFLKDPSTVLLRHDQPDNHEVFEHDIFQLIAGLGVPHQHVAVVLESTNWREVIVVFKGVKVADVIKKIFGSTDAVKCVRHKGGAIDLGFTCCKPVTLQIEFQSKLKFIRFNMNTRVYAMKVKPFHTGADCKALIASHLGLPVGLLRLFHGFHQLQDTDSIWSKPSVFEAKTFPMRGGCANATKPVDCPNTQQCCERNLQPDRVFSIDGVISNQDKHVALEDMPDAVYNAVTSDPIDVWIKSPISGKVIVVKVVDHDTIEKVYDQTFPDLPNATFMCDGKIISKTLPCRSVGNRVVSCRFYPLKGGAKGEGKLKVSNQVKAFEFMTEQLGKRGVPKDVINERAKKVVTAVSVDFVIKNMDSGDFWQQLKNEASKQMVRLILPSELKAWQQSRRAESRQEQSKTKKGANPAFNPKDLVLQVKDFQADGKTLPWISEDAIKPDSTGVCLLPPGNAKHFLPPKKLSPDGLAIVTLGVLMPTEAQIQYIVTSKTGEDFIVRGNIFQFGDTQVVHCPACPTAQVQEVASSVLEVIIGKDCPWWSMAVADAIAAITKLDSQTKFREAIVGQWKFRPYDQSRTPASSDDAAHIHGYLRVRDSMIDDLLKLSGQNAIFFNTRVNGGGKDDRFSFIPLPDMSLEEAKCKTQTIQFSLGIVKGRGHFTLRCRREHYKKVMKQMNPDMTFGDSSDDEADMQSKYRLEGIHFQTTARELTSALKSLGWKAKASRATGASSWLIVAEGEPRNRSFSLNNQLVVVKDIVPKTALKHFVVSAPIESHEKPTVPIQPNPGPVSTRMEKIESELDTKIQKMVDKQMQDATAKIDRLEESIKTQEKSQSELKTQFDQQRVEIAKVSTQITDVASELQTTQASMLSSFELLIKSEMKNLQQKLSSDREESEEKRRRREWWRQLLRPMSPFMIPRVGGFAFVFPGEVVVLPKPCNISCDQLPPCTCLPWFVPFHRGDTVHWRYGSDTIICNLLDFALFVLLSIALAVVQDNRYDFQQSENACVLINLWSHRLLHLLRAFGVKLNHVMRQHPYLLRSNVLSFLDQWWVFQTSLFCIALLLMTRGSLFDIYPQALYCVQSFSLIRLSDDSVFRTYLIQCLTINTLKCCKAILGPIQTHSCVAYSLLDRSVSTNATCIQTSRYLRVSQQKSQVRVGDGCHLTNTLQRVYLIAICILQYVVIPLTLLGRYSYAQNMYQQLFPDPPVSRFGEYGHCGFSERSKKDGTGYILRPWKQVASNPHPFLDVRHVTIVATMLSMRYGEAKNPGPDHSIPMDGLLAVGTINPTSIVSKLETLFDLGPGIWSMSETSATSRQQKITRSFFKNKSWNVVFGAPVKAHANKFNALRGVAQGVGLFSPLPSWKAIAPLPKDLEASCRILVSFTQVSPNLVIQVITLYGPTPKCMMSPLAFLDKLMRFALERSRSFHGPTIILGDLNYTLDEIPSWGLYQQCGFVDAASVDANRRKTLPQPTCRGLTRKSFILIPPELQNSLVHCDILDDHLFDSHPILRALFKIDCLTLAPTKLWFPKAFDDFFHDHEVADKLGHDILELKTPTFDALLERGQMDEAALLWTDSVEQVLRQSAVDVEGNPIDVPKGNLGRTKSSTTRTQPPSVPIPKPGREGDFEPEGEFHSVKLRRWLRQVRRLQTMVSNRTSLNHTPPDRRPFVASKCNELWKSILNAKGFHGGFISFLLDYFEMIPHHCPDLPLLNEIKDVMMVAYRNFEKDIFRKQNAQRMNDIRFDLAKKGGRMAFRMMKEDDRHISPVFQKKNVFHLKKQRIFHKGQHTLFVDDGSTLNPDLPIIYDTQCVLIRSVEGNAVNLREPIFLRSGINSFFQTEVAASDEEKAQLSIEFWNQCWQRDNRAHDDAILQAAQHIIDCVPCWSPYPGQRATVEQFKHALRGTKKRNMRGSCKFSTIELQRIPDSLLEILIKLFTAIENGQPWPKQWMTAFVVFLPKVDDAQAPCELRPITVISKIYRVWARMHALQVITWASQNVAPFIGGGIREVNPQELMTYIQFVIESHSASHRSLQGLVLDIQKAFNNIHRTILEVIFRKLGMPEWIIVPYRNMMRQVARQLVFPTHVTEGVLSTCGVPEGCPLAVLGMLAYTVNLHGWLCSREPDNCFYGFADNWSLYSSDVQKLKAGIQDVEEFCDLMQLPLAGDKSWVWSTCTKGRKALAHITLQGKHVPIRHNEKELGCDMQYTKKPCRQVFQKRMGTTIDKLKKVPRIPVQKKFKKRLVKGSAMPSCEYGTTVIHASKQELQKLRSEVGKALGGGRAGESPYLTCIFGGKDIADPEFIFVVDKLRVLRSLATKSWFSRQKFLALAAEPGDRPGPAKSLHDALLNMDLGIILEGNITFHHGVTINVFLVNFPFLIQLLEYEWAWVVSCRLSTKRKVWKPVYFNPRQFQCFESRFSEQQIQTLLVHINGAYYTNDHLARFKSDHNDMCPWCEDHDSIRHRTQCKFIQDIRNKHLNLADLGKTDDIFVHHGIQFIPDDVWDLMHQLSLRRMCSPQVPPGDSTHFTLYIDGSCTDPTISLAKLSSGAVNLVQGPFQSTTVASQIVPGVEQSSSRGEILAGILALSFAYTITVHTDYQLFHDRVHDLKNGGRPQTNWTNIDLWNIVYNLVKDRCEHIRIVKVKAHEDWEKLSGDRRMQAWHNHQVDLAAKKEISNSPLFRKYQKIVKLLKHQDELLKGYAGFLVDSAMDVFKTKVSKEHYRVKFDVNNLKARGQGEPSWVCNSTFEHLDPKSFRFPRAFLEAIVTWFSKLSWGFDFDDHCNCITWVELYIDLTISTGCLAPVRLPSTNSKWAGEFVERDSDWGKHVNPLLGTDAFAFASAIKFLQRKNILRLPTLAPRVSMSSVLGLAEKYAGLALRPKLTNDTYAAIWLQKAIPYFCPARGNLNFVLNHIPAMQNLDTSDGNVGHSL